MQKIQGVWRRRTIRTRSGAAVFLAAAAVGLYITATLAAVGSDDPALPHYGEPRMLALLMEPAINESSGLAASQYHADLFWTHNDSGDSPRLFVFDAQGKLRAEHRIPQARAMDWEDMASFQYQGRAYLLVADVGDNRGVRDESQLYLLTEPQDIKQPPALVMTLRFQYEDGPQNCEAVGVDPNSSSILLVSKKAPLQSAVYQLPLPKQAPAERLTAQKIAACPLPWPTAMDVSSDGHRAVILTYAHAVEYHRGNQETWAEAFARPGRVLPMPIRRQGETICYGADGKTLFLTSEIPPVPFFCVPVE